MPALTGVERSSLSAVATRLRSASRCVAIACEQHAVLVPEVLSAWPSQPRRGGWARSRESDQAEDERLHDVIAAGRRMVDSLRAHAPHDPLVRLAETTFTTAASAFVGLSRALHLSRSAGDVIPGSEACQPLHRAAVVLVHELDRVMAHESRTLIVGMLPPGVRAAAHVLQDDLRALSTAGAPDASAAWRQLARDLDGTLGLVAQHADAVPKSVLGASELAAGGLALWDTATGSFRGTREVDLVQAVSRTAIRADARAQPDVDAVNLAASQLTWRLDEVGDRLSARTVPDVAPVAHQVNRSYDLRDGGYAPLTLPARDDAYRDLALDIIASFGRIAGECFDNVDPSHHALGRSLVRARRAAAEYQAASDALAERVQADSGRPPVPAQDVLPGLHEGLLRADRFLSDRAIGEVAVAEMSAARRDVAHARGAHAAVGDLPDGRLAVGLVDRRACQSIRSLLAGDYGGQLAADAQGRGLHDDLRAACAQLEHAIGVPPATPQEAVVEPTSWLAAPAVSSDRAASSARGWTTRVARSRGVGRGTRFDRGHEVSRGP
ncbi:MAG TPA: hypothetical protein VN193_02690 [Candidatus Angelobacter sp.]|nr:hypothetical protein [Candidatus Angelobacter sp.]